MIIHYYSFVSLGEPLEELRGVPVVAELRAAVLELVLVDAVVPVHVQALPVAPQRVPVFLDQELAELLKASVCTNFLYH